MNIGSQSIIRNQSSDSLGLLIGNGEMGGLVRGDGLGIDELWLTDFWSNEAERTASGPLRLVLSGVEGAPVEYRQELSIDKGVVETYARYHCGAAYRVEIFFSQSERHFLVLRLENCSAEPQQWCLDLPGEPVVSGEGILKTGDAATAAPMVLPYTRLAWVVRSSVSMECESRIGFELKPGEAVELVNCLVTSFDTLDFEEVAMAGATNAPDFAVLRAMHVMAWQEMWGRFEVSLPPGDYADTFYRSIYYTLSITGASQFLPGVCQFADPAWGMIPFSNDAGYIVPLLASLNQHERALAMLEEFYKPESLRKNARAYLNILEAFTTQDDYDDAFSFAQMIGISGAETNFVYGRQRHLDGFMPAIFHRTSSLLPDNTEAREMTYSVLKGCAIFWMQMLIRDEERGVLLIRKTLDLDEKTHGVSVMSAVIACHWTLKMFVRMARERGEDSQFALECEHALALLYWPQNEERYLSYPDDREESVDSKYNCIRSFSTLAYPYCELISEYDWEKACSTLDSARARNQLEDVGAGVNAMTTNMYALTEAVMKRSQLALQYVSLSLKRLDPSGVAMGEARTDSLFYCSTSYCTFALTTLQMLLQSYDGVIYPFPAVPSEWKEVSFSGLPAEHGIQVSAEMREGRVVRVVYKRGGRVLLEKQDAQPVKIVVTGETVVLVDLNEITYA